MRIDVNQIVFPEGDRQEIPHRLRFGDLVDLNGYPLAMPLRNARIIAFRVYRISHRDTRNEEITEYHLEQVFPDELAGYT